MAANTRSRSGSGGTRSTRSSSGRSSASSRRTSSSRSTSSRNGSGSGKTARTAASRARSRATKPAPTESVKETLNGAAGTIGDAAQTVGHAVKSVAIPVGTAVVGAAAGVVGGVVLGRTKMTRKRKVLGIPMPGSPSRDGVEYLAKNVGEAGKQFNKLADEVCAARKKAESVGKALS